jgi:transposase
MAITDAAGLPIAVWTAGANRHEVKLVEDTLSVFVVDETPKRLIADRAYDSDPLRKELSKKGIELICPHRKNRKKPRTQDGRKLRRYARRWKVERYFAWLHNYRRCVVRYDFYDRNFEGFILVATLAIYLKKYF